MAGTSSGAILRAATMRGLSPAEYRARLEAGEHWCSTCKAWRPNGRFGPDPSRSSGLAAHCRDCRERQRIARSVLAAAGHPGKRERQLQRAIGLKWCSVCMEWLPALQVAKSGRCRPHENEWARKHYAAGARVMIAARVHARKRGIAPIPEIGKRHLLELFEGKCAYCGVDADSWDHIDPVRHGGRTRPGNIVPACKRCNSSKRDRDVAEWMRSKGYTPSDTFIGVTILLHEVAG